MNRCKCGQCGLVNPALKDRCKRCGALINDNYRLKLTSQATKPVRRRFSLTPLLLILAVGGGGYAYWNFRTGEAANSSRPPVASVASNEQGMLYEAIRPANTQGGPPVAGIRSTFENSKALTDANKRSQDIEKLTAAPANKK